MVKWYFQINGEIMREYRCWASVYRSGFNQVHIRLRGERIDQKPLKT